MLLGYSFEPRANSCALGTADLLMTIGLSKMLALKKKQFAVRKESRLR